MTGCLLARACFVACLFGESSQQRVPPHTWHVRKWTHSVPLLTQSSHSRRFGCLTVATARICVHVVSGIVFLLFSQHHLRPDDRSDFADQPQRNEDEVDQAEPILDQGGPLARFCLETTNWAVIDRPYSSGINTVGAVYDRATPVRKSFETETSSSRTANCAHVVRNFIIELM